MAVLLGELRQVTWKLSKNARWDRLAWLSRLSVITILGMSQEAPGCLGWEYLAVKCHIRVKGLGCISLLQETSCCDANWWRYWARVLQQCSSANIYTDSSLHTSMKLGNLSLRGSDKIAFFLACLIRSLWTQSNCNDYKGHGIWSVSALDELSWPRGYLMHCAGTFSRCPLAWRGFVSHSCDDMQC